MPLRIGLQHHKLVEERSITTAGPGHSQHLEVLGGHCCSASQSCPTLCNPVDCSKPGFPVFHHLLELAQTHVHRVSDSIHHFILCHPLLLLPSIFPSIRVFFSPKNQLFASGGQNIGASALASVLPANIQG